MEKTQKHKLGKIFLGFAVTALALWLSFRKIDWTYLGESFARIQWLWVFIAVANTLIVVYVLGFRWQILLKPKGQLPLGSLFRLNIISQCINIISPARIGEVIRAYMTSRQHQVSGAYVLGTIAVEKIFDFFTFVVLWIFVPVLFTMQEEARWHKSVLYVCALAALILFFFLWKPRAFLRITRKMMSFLPEKIVSPIINFLEKCIEAFSQLKNVKTLFIVLSLTLVLIMGQVLTIYLLFLSFDLKLSVWVALFLLLAIQLGKIPPSVPGKIGVFEYTMILALSLFGIEKSLALSFGITLHAVAVIPKIILGGFFLMSMDISMKKTSKIKI